MSEYIELNRANWDDRVPVHVAAADYAVRRFLDDPSFLSDAVRFDLPLLGDVSGLRGVDPQCHIGTGTVSLARLGTSMTGLDFSGPAVADAVIAHTVTHWWNHGIGETVTALLDAGLTLTGLAEHPSVPWRAFPGQVMASAGGGEWQLAERPERLAASFTIQAVRNF